MGRRAGWGWAGRLGWELGRGWAGLGTGRRTMMKTKMKMMMKN